MTKPALPPEYRRVQISATVSPETARAIKELARPGEGLGQVIDRAVEALKGGKKF